MSRLMRAAVSSRAGRCQGPARVLLTPWRAGLWRLPLATPGVVVGVTDRSCDLDGLRARLAACAPEGLVLAEQIHGASIASIESPAAAAAAIPGCDGLLTQTPGLALVIRSADCLPLFIVDPCQRVVGAVHAGWRGLARGVVWSLVDALATRYHSRCRDVWVGIGPAIRACCYEVGAEFERLFDRFTRTAGARRTCDLPGAAIAQAVSLGVSASRVIDCGVCTACDPGRWHSVRREGEAAGRLLSFICIGRSGTSPNA